MVAHSRGRGLLEGKLEQRGYTGRYRDRIFGEPLSIYRTEEKVGCAQQRAWATRGKVGTEGVHREV